jgi:hypothetical protein
MWTRSLLAAKVRAWLMHLGISALIFLPFLYVMWSRWFPPPLFFTDGGVQGLKIMLPVDLVIGPSLTFLVFDPAKRRMETMIELMIIGCIQGIALAYGFTAVEGRRVVAVSYTGTQFIAVNQSLAQRQPIDPADWDRLGPGPIRWGYWVGAQKPEDADLINGLLQFQVAPTQVVKLLRPLSEYTQALRQKAIDMAQLTATRPALKEEYAVLLAQHPQQELFCFWLEGIFGRAIVVLDADNRLAGALYRIQ